MQKALKRPEVDGFSWGKIKTDNKGFISVDGSTAVIAGKPLDWWIDKYDLPLHIMYSPFLVENIEEYKNVFSQYYPQGEVRLAGKVNTHPSVFKIMAREKVGIDVASLFEMECALSSGVDPFDLDVNGNCKCDELIKTAIEKNMLLVSDNIDEFKHIAGMAKSMAKKARTVLRVTGFNLGSVTDPDLYTSGVWSKFGEDLRNIPDFIKTLEHYPEIDFWGFHTHIGSQITDIGPFRDILATLIELGSMLKESGGDCRMLNIGGGMPAAYVENKEVWDYVLGRIKQGYLAAQNGDTSKIFVWNNGVGQFVTKPDGSIDWNNWSGDKFYTDYPRAEMLKTLLTSDITINGKQVKAVEALAKIGNPALAIEPGRSVAEKSGITLAKVGYTRQIADGHNLVTLEASVTSYATAMLFPPVNWWTVMNDPLRKDEEPFEAFVAGHLCYSGDIISKYKVFLQRKPRRGDVLAKYHTGAYDPNFFAANTNSFPRPARVLAHGDGRVDVIKSKDTYNEVFSL